MDDEFIKQVSRKAKILLASAGISATLLTGTGGSVKKFIPEDIPNESPQEQMANDDNFDILAVNIPENIKKDVVEALKKSDKAYANLTINDTICIKDLKNITNLSLNMNQPTNLFFLNFCINDKVLELHFTGTSDFLGLITIERLPNLEDLTITDYSNSDDFYIDQDYGKFILNSHKLKSLDLYRCGIDPAITNKLINLKTLGINSYCHPEDINFRKLNNLGQVYLNDGMYDAGIYFDDKMINAFNSYNIHYSLNQDNEHSTDDLLNINKQLNKIVANLSINENSTDQEKLNAVLYYILSKYNYDPNHYKDIDKNHNFNGDKYYLNGWLYGAFNRNDIICGNYAGITQALLNRIGVKSHLLKSYYHAYNLVMVNGTYYYVDATWLDNEEKISKTYYLQLKQKEFTNKYIVKTTKESATDALKNGDINNKQYFPSYMINPDTDYKFDHSNLNMPSDEALSNDIPVVNKPIEDITNKIFYFINDNFIRGISGKDLIDILVLLGMAKATDIILTNKCKKAKEREDNEKTL